MSEEKLVFLNENLKVLCMLDFSQSSILQTAWLHG